MNPILASKLDFRRLQMLVALDETRSVSKVADLLHVSQPAISKVLIALEAELGVTLFTRTINGMEPTPQGATLIHHARLILVDLRHAHQDLQDVRAGRVARLSLGVLPIAAPTLLPGFIHRLESQSVSVSIEVQEDNMASLLPKLRAGDIDFLIGNLPKQSLSHEFGQQFLYEDRLCCVARQGHPIFQHRQHRWDQIGRYPLLLPPPTAYTRPELDAFLAQKGLVIPRRHVESFSTVTNIGVLRRTDAIAIVTREVARHFAAQGLLAPLQVRMPPIAVQVGLVWMAQRHKESTRHNVCRLFGEVAATIVAAQRANSTAQAPEDA